MGLRKTDVVLKHAVISRQAWRDKKMRERALKLEKYVVAAHEVMELKHPVIVRFCSLGWDLEGSSSIDGRGIEVNVNAKGSTFERLVVMMHEFVHAKDFQDKRLTYKFSTKSYYWEGKRYPFQDKIEFVAYKQLPWEKKAFSNQRKLARIVKAYVENCL